MSTINIILQAARQRFSDYGPCKTTMAEIAADCNMSVGNLYRHFENKDAIMIASMAQQLQEKLDAGIAAAADMDDGLEALRAFLQTRLQLAHAQFTGTRHLFDLLCAIESRHHHVLLTYEKKVIAAIAEILQQAMAHGQLSCADPGQTAYDIHQATLRYNNPVTLQYYPLNELSDDLNRLLNLLHSGLRAR